MPKPVDTHPAAASLLVSPEWLANNLANEDLVILDATVWLAPPTFDGEYRVESGHENWLTAHIPGAVHADLLEDLSDAKATFGFTRPDNATLIAALEKLGADTGKTIVIYDADDGFWATRLWYVLHATGYEAKVLDGGLKLWQGLSLPLSAGEDAPRCSGHVPSLPVRPHAWASRADVEAVLAGLRPDILVCALSRRVFTGEKATRYARRGHIPGSLNFPARDLLAPDGRYLPIEQLRAKVSAVIGQANGGESGRPVLLYCGGGISACVLAFVLTLLGHDDFSVYDGSLEEWAADFSLPLVVSV
jgi:thiosulfate/3-mercaptopyruvate sulfurtransferase